MCPLCVSTMAMLALGGGSGASLAAFLIALRKRS